MKKSIVAVLLAGALLLAGCAREEEPAQATIFAMDTVMTLQAWGQGKEDAVSEAVNRINELDALLAVNREGSDLWALNHADEPVAVSDDTWALISMGKSLYESTGGALDIAMYPIVRAWGFTTEEYRVVDEAERQALLAHTDLDQMELYEDTEEVALPEGMELDLGSLAKGYTGDQVMNLFREHGIEHALIDLGGNVHALGSRPNGGPWRVAVRDPEGGEGYIGVLEVEDKAVITSGGYERYFEANGVRYWHIMDPETGAPADSGLISATVVGDQGVLCDGLSTALFVLGADRAADYWRENGGFEFLLVDSEHTIYITQGLKDSFTIQPDYKSWPVQVVTP